MFQEDIFLSQLEMKSKMMEAKFQEEKLKLQQKHDTTVQKVLRNLSIRHVVQISIKLVSHILQIVYYYKGLVLTTGRVHYTNIYSIVWYSIMDLHL